MAERVTDWSQKFAIPGDLDKIASLPEPDASEFESAPADELGVMVGNLRGVLISLTQPTHWKAEPDSKAKIFAFGGDEGFWNALTKVAEVYAAGFHQLAAVPGIGVGLADFVSNHPLPFAKDPRNPELKHYPKLTVALATLVFHDACCLYLCGAAHLDEEGFLPGELGADHDPDVKVAEGLMEFHSSNCRAQGQRRELGSHLLQACMEFRLRALRKRSERRQELLKTSSEGLNPRELNLLAKRNSVMGKKYGEKRIERIFEQRLALLFQSFGFTVVQAKPGKEAADLLCIARAERFSFLVDAKSTRGAYALPKADQRALVDYVQQFSNRLPDLPPLAMLLVVGPNATGTLHSKMKALEERVELPTRFVPIAVLSRLRQSIPGPLPPSMFRDAVRRSDVILDESVAGEIKSSLDGLSSAYDRFIENLQDATAP